MTKDDVVTVWDVLKAGGLRPKSQYPTPEEVVAGVELWESMLAGVPVALVIEAAKRHLASPEGKWWPKPGDLIKHLPKGRPVEDYAPEEEFVGKTWALLSDGVLRIKLMDQAMAETPCSCKIGCEQCGPPMLARCDELAREAVAKGAKLRTHLKEEL